MTIEPLEPMESVMRATRLVRDSLNHLEVATGLIDSAVAHFQVQLADEARHWLVPPAHRPTCPLDQTPCTHWSCLVDVCVDAKVDGEAREHEFRPRSGGVADGEN